LWVKSVAEGNKDDEEEAMVDTGGRTVVVMGVVMVDIR
jgi:hypothetical protein